MKYFDHKQMLYDEKKYQLLLPLMNFFVLISNNKHMFLPLRLESNCLLVQRQNYVINKARKIYIPLLQAYTAVTGGRRRFVFFI